MTAQLGQWRATYTPGRWVVLSGPTSLVIIQPAPAKASQMVNSLWDVVVASASLEEMAGELAKFRVDQMPSFGALFWTDGAMRSLVRGQVKLVDIATGNVVADGDGITTWSESGLGDVRQVRIDMEDIDQEQLLQLPLVVGAVTASAIVVDCTNAVSSPQGQAAGQGADQGAGAGATGSTVAAAAEPDAEPRRSDSRSAAEQAASEPSPARAFEGEDISGGTSPAARPHEEIAPAPRETAESSPQASEQASAPQGSGQPLVDATLAPEDLASGGGSDSASHAQSGPDSSAGSSTESGSGSQSGGGFEFGGAAAAAGGAALGAGAGAAAASAAPSAPSGAPAAPAPPAPQPSASQPSASQGPASQGSASQGLGSEQPFGFAPSAPMGGLGQGGPGQGPGSQPSAPHPGQQGGYGQPDAFPGSQGQGGQNPYGQQQGRDQYDNDQYGADQYGQNQGQQQNPYGQDQYGGVQFGEQGQQQYGAGQQQFGSQQAGQQQHGQQQYGQQPYGQQFGSQQYGQQGPQQQGPQGYGGPQGGQPGPYGQQGPGAEQGDMVLALQCPNRHPNPPDARQCRRCGAPLQGQPQLIGKPVLATLRPNSGQPLDVDRSVLIGRSPTANRVAREALPRLLTVPSPSHDISRTHLEVSPDGWNLTVTDLHSTNGTRLVRPSGEHEQLPPGEPVPVHPGCVLDLGDGVTILVDDPA